MRRTIYQISMDGSDVSSALAPILHTLSIRMGDQDEADSLSMELDDTGGQILLPAEGAPISASIFWDDDGRSVEFEGFLDGAHCSGTEADDEGSSHHRHAHRYRHGRHGHGGGSQTIRSEGSRGGGRTLTITAKSADMSSKLKERTSAHKDKTTFGDVAPEWGKAAGLSDVKVDGKLASVKRDYWSMAHESFLTWGTRIARELGATFKVIGKTAVFVSRSGGTAATGQQLTPIAATWGDNLISWEMTPTLSRPAYSMAEAGYYDPQQAAPQKEQASGASSAKATATHRHPHKVANKDQAMHQADANKTELDREKGVGTVTIDGEPAAQASAMCTVSGIRPGVDGTYLVSQVTHNLSRHGGWTTHVELKQPNGDAGSDTRGTTNQPASPAALADT